MPRRILPSPRAALGILTGLNFLNYVDRFIPAAVMPAIIAALHLTDSQAGSLSTLFILTYSVVSPGAGWLADRKPRFQLAAIGRLHLERWRRSARGWRRPSRCWSWRAR